ncbi:hypothetical protein PR048_007542 [Dryococelus australis]|uniref:Uncharacterized protein n=1 Tax=Dryococelus australis TaxID=614101 RepID=A0ABQ9HUM5_9NEOP|nr:hypothetical protein PR048_007542 [Dryococelus australis]
MQGKGETGVPQVNPPTSGIVRHDSHLRKSESDPTGQSQSTCSEVKLSSLWQPMRKQLRIQYKQDCGVKPAAATSVTFAASEHQSDPTGKRTEFDSPRGRSHLGIVPDDAACQRVSSGISRFPPVPYHTIIGSSRPPDLDSRPPDIFVQSAVAGERVIVPLSLRRRLKPCRRIPPAELGLEWCEAGRSPLGRSNFNFTADPDRKPRTGGLRSCEARGEQDYKVEAALEALRVQRVCVYTEHYLPAAPALFPDTRIQVCYVHFMTAKEVLSRLKYSEVNNSCLLISCQEKCCSGVVVRPLAFHLGEPGSVPSRVAPGFSHVGIVRNDAACRRVFSVISRFPGLCIPALPHTRFASPSLALKRAVHIYIYIHSTRMEGRGKREIPEKTRRPTASSGTIPTCENPVTRPGIEPGSGWWEAIGRIAPATVAPLRSKLTFLLILRCGHLFPRMVQATRAVVVSQSPYSHLKRCSILWARTLPIDWILRAAKCPLLAGQSAGEQIFSAFDAGRLRSDKGDSALRIKYAVAIKRVALNWRAVIGKFVERFNVERLSSFVCIERGNFEKAVSRHFGVPRACVAKVHAFISLTCPQIITRIMQGSSDDSPGAGEWLWDSLKEIGPCSQASPFLESGRPSTHSQLHLPEGHVTLEDCSVASQARGPLQTESRLQSLCVATNP